MHSFDTSHYITPYTGGFTKPEGFDLTLPELNVVGKLKDKIWPQPRQDFYACVQVIMVNYGQLWSTMVNYGHPCGFAEAKEK